MLPHRTILGFTVVRARIAAARCMIAPKHVKVADEYQQCDQGLRLVDGDT
jgi:hypothetical protein